MTNPQTLFDQAKEFVVRGVAAQRAIDNILRSHKSNSDTSKEATEKEMAKKKSEFARLNFGD